MHYPLRDILLPGNLPVLSGIIVHIHIFIPWIWEGEGEHHLLELLQIFLCSEIMPPDVPILLHLSSLSFLIGSSQIVHVHNLLIDMSYSLWHSFIDFTILAIFQALNSRVRLQ